MEDEKLIDAVFRYDFIYDRNHPKHSIRDYVAQAWEDIASETNSNVDQVKRRWSNLRDYFRKQLKERSKPSRKRSGYGTSKKKEWVFFDRMSFLIPYTKGSELYSNLGESATTTINTTTGPTSPTTLEMDSQEIVTSDSDDELSDSSQTGSVRSTSPIPTPSKIPQYVKRGKRQKRKGSDNDVKMERIKAFKHPVVKDDDEQFFKSCLPMVKDLSHEQKLEFRISVQQLLLKSIREKKAEPSVQQCVIKHEDDSPMPSL